MKRKGFSLLTAIMFIVLIATIGALALSFSTHATKQTGDTYMRVQAELLSRSATEYAILALTAHDIVTNDNCINTITITYPTAAAPIFNITMNIKYFGQGLPNNCNIVNNNADGENAITTDDSHVTFIVDTFVESAGGITTEPIRIHRRTLQKL